MLNVHDGRHQREKAEIAFDHGEERADPSAVACAEHAELIAAMCAQRCHQLSQFRHALA